MVTHSLGHLNGLQVCLHTSLSSSSNVVPPPKLADENDYSYELQHKTRNL